MSTTSNTVKRSSCFKIMTQVFFLHFLFAFIVTLFAPINVTYLLISFLLFLLSFICAMLYDWFLCCTEKTDSSAGEAIAVTGVVPSTSLVVFAVPLQDAKQQQQQQQQEAAAMALYGHGYAYTSHPDDDSNSSTTAAADTEKVTTEVAVHPL